MSITSLVLATIICYTPKIKNVSNEKWKAIDSRNFQIAQMRCRNFQDVPCLKFFVKKEPLVYNAICSSRRKI